MTEERKEMLEKFCVGPGADFCLGGILFFLTLLSAVVTCRVYGGSEICTVWKGQSVSAPVFLVRV